MPSLTAPVVALTPIILVLAARGRTGLAAATAGVAAASATARGCVRLAAAVRRPAGGGGRHAARAAGQLQAARCDDVDQQQPCVVRGGG
jgi:hypothetical protein